MPLEVFYSYAHEDEMLRNQLNKHLSALEREGLIVGWHDRKIGAGSEWRDQIDEHLRSAHVILFLVSSGFIASDYCYDVEVREALERHARHEAVVIPVILRSVDWSLTPFAKLQALPRDAKPVTSWANQDEAFTDIARSIREVVERYVPSSAAQGPTSQRSTLIDNRVAEDRILDAAIPSHIVKDLAAEMLVQIHRPDSPGLKGVLQMEEDHEARPEDVRSKQFGVVFPLGPDGRPEQLKTTIALDSPDFSPPRQAKNLYVPPDKDSEVVDFLLTPRRTGRLTVLVELQWEDALRGSRSLRTECVAEATSLPAQTQLTVARILLKSPGATLHVPPKPSSSQPGTFTALFHRELPPVAPVQSSGDCIAIAASAGASPGADTPGTAVPGINLLDAEISNDDIGAALAPCPEPKPGHNQERATRLFSTPQSTVDRDPPVGGPSAFTRIIDSSAHRLGEEKNDSSAAPLSSPPTQGASMPMASAPVVALQWPAVSMPAPEHSSAYVPQTSLPVLTQQPSSPHAAIPQVAHVPWPQTPPPPAVPAVQPPQPQLQSEEQLPEQSWWITYLPLIIGLNVLLFLAVVLVLIFALKK